MDVSEYMIMYFRSSCLIDEGNTFLITGGYYPQVTSTVSRYNAEGWIEDIGNLNNARFGHGCSRYTNIFGKEVSSFLVLWDIN